MVEPKDFIQIIKLKQEMDAQYVTVQVETYKRQVDIIKQAILDVVPPELQSKLVARIKRIRAMDEDVIEHEKLLVQNVAEETE
jgi:hypothetical protein